MKKSFIRENILPIYKKSEENVENYDINRRKSKRKIFHRAATVNRRS